jgi:gliding motility-associated-like protein
MIDFHKILHFLFFFCVITNSVRAQCVLTANPDSISITCGQTITLTAQVFASAPVLSENFNNNTIGVGWNASIPVNFSSPCGPSLDGSPSAWMGSDVFPRVLTTVGFDLSCGAQVCFDLDFANDENTLDCEDPDQIDEGVFFQYSLDNGITWIDIFYFEPTNNMTGPYFTWANYCFDIPVGAFSTNTMFQWNQPNATPGAFDHWGVDNVEITPYACGGGSAAFDWDNLPGGNDPSTIDVSPQTSTTYVVEYSDGIDQCSDTVVVNVAQLIAEASASDSSFMCPNCVTLDAQLVNNSSGSVIDDFDPGINPLMWSDIQSGVSGSGCGGLSGNALYFDGTGAERHATTIPIDASFCSTIDFCLYMGNANTSGAPCENADVNENISLEYSTDGGITWIQIVLYDHSLWDSNDAWQCFSETIPVAAVSPNTMFRWSQIQFSSCTGCDNWSLDDVNISCNPPLFDYDWSPATDLDDSSLQNPESCAVAPTNYTVTITDPATGCSATDDVFLDIACGCMFTTFTANASQCETGNIFMVSGNFEYIVNPGTGTIEIEVTNASGTYTQTVNGPFTNQQVYNYQITSIPADGSPFTVDIYFSDELTCSTQEAGVSPITPDIISIFGGNIYCPGDVVTTIQADASGNGPWTIDYTIDGVPQTVTDVNDTLDLGITEGVYDLVSVTDAGGCVINVVGQDEILFQPIPTIESFTGGNEYCADSTASDILIEITGIPDWILEYNYNGNLQTINSTDTIINLGNAEGAYELVHLYDANCDAPVSGTQEIIINPLPPVDAGQDYIICDGDQTVLSGEGALTYQWDNGVTDAQPFVPVQTTTYTVSGTDANGCQESDDIIVTVESLPVPSFYADTLQGCEPLTITFYNTTTGNLSNCEWSFGDGSGWTGCNLPVNTFEYSGNYDVSLQTTSINGCVGSTTYNDYIYVEAVPDASFIPSLYSVISLEPDVSFDNTSTGAVTYVWDFGDGSQQSTDVNPSHSFPDNVTTGYDVWLYAYSPIGCVDSTVNTIRVDEVIIFYIPNTFTPDDDELNQIFQPVFTSGFDPYDFNLKIYNRWGQVVFESNDATQGWDGTYGGEKVQDGLFTWKIEFKSISNDERFIHTGHVNVLK